MVWEGVLIAVDEIWTKSERVRRKLMKMLLEDIKERLKTEKIRLGRGRIFIEEYKKEFEEKLRKVFGVSYFSPHIISKTDIEEIKRKTLDLLRGFNGTFKIDASRAWKGFEYNSLEINRIVGKYIVKEKGLKVDIRNPDRTIYIEVHKDKTYLFYEKIGGPGGLPLGCQGKGLMLFSGGIDSPVAAYLIGRRGLDLDFLFVNFGGPIFESMVYKVYEKIKEYFPKSRFFVLDLDLSKLFSVKEGYRQIVLKVLLYKIAEEFCKKGDHKVIVTGESLGQVSTQILYNLVLLSKFVSITIFRPLIGMNKNEIVEIAKKIETFEVSSRVPEICQVERKTKLYPEYDVVLEEFEGLKLNISKLVDKIRLGEKSFENFEDLFPKEKDLIVIDVKDYPSYNFEKNKKYLLVCPKGTTSIALARELREEGIEAYALDYKTARRLGYIK